MTEKQLLLALSFDEAPKEIQSLAKEFKKSFARLEKAKKQNQLWAQELDQAKIENAKTLKVFQDAFDAWDPVGIKAMKPEELK